MSVSTIWIKDNMLFYDNCQRKLTEAELKVQRSIKNLSIPDWYLNKRSNPPKILNKIPIECRPPSWKKYDWRNTSTLNSASSIASDTLPFSQRLEKSAASSSSTNTYKVSHHQMTTEELNHRTESQLKPSGKLMDTNIPDLKPRRNISKTFPKMSPSRKIQNINIVFPPKSLKLSSEFGVEPEEKKIQISNYNSFEMKQTCDENKMLKDYETTPRKTNGLAPTKITCTPRTPNVDSAFQIRATSTPKFKAAVKLLTPTNIEETPKLKKIPSRNILEKISIFEDSWSNSTLRSEKAWKSMSEETSRLENSWNKNTFSASYTETPKPSQRLNSLLERSIRSINPILFETVDSTNSKNCSTLVRDIVKKVEHSMINQDCSVKKSTLEWNKSKQPRVPKTFPRTPIQQKDGGKAEPEANIDSPVTKFLNSRRKSTELNNVVRSKLAPREKGVVRGIIEALAERSISQSSLPRQKQVVGVHNSFVKSVVSTLEKRSSSSMLNKTIRCIQDEEDLGSGSGYESEVKSCTTSVSPKDTDSSDFEQRSPRQSSDDSHRTFDFDSTLDTKKPLQLEEGNDEDSVYWIPVSRCKLPRTSSLLSMMSRLSVNTDQSPSVSPIKSDSEAENTFTRWDATYKGSRNLTKRIFRIDETTTVIDSGYSDKSGRSVVGCSLTDSTLSEDTQNESGSEVSTNRTRRSCNRKPIPGITFRMQC
ncbi:uncharacterized protein LOC144478278 [Augochlora pura]